MIWFTFGENLANLSSIGRPPFETRSPTVRNDNFHVSPGWGGEVGVRVSYGRGGGGVDVSLSLNPPDFPGVLRQKTKSEPTGIESVLAKKSPAAFAA